ncbi:ABC transporter substrate-binding protein [Bradyrhizobium sp. NC92]|uniref:ABC transporter substrate-binding protein n=1 Tax=Bradyrhizobium sp. (strain NC92) TaxID=55395 RepID=UPI0021AA0B47|nr:ABC transporter substrate-binding protein [Bradyrhizobium sp. NC92]UWU70506.1 ABC transporter substrate-binding protein [Bradyrhizobium sp. NC92]
MNRRQFIATAVCMIGWPVVGLAQRTGSVPRIGFLGLGKSEDWTDQIEALRLGLKRFGYHEGRNLLIEFRWAAAIAELDRFAEELSKLNVDIIIAPASTQVEPALRATRTIPIVFAQHADPVGIGHVASLAHPGGNVTGVSMVLTEMAAKGLEILVEAQPGTKRVGVLWNLTTPTHARVLSVLEEAAKRKSIDLVGAPISTADDFNRAFDLMVNEKVASVLVPSSPITNARRRALAELGIKHRLPTMFANRANVEAGGLMSYGPNFNSMYRYVAFFVDKILKGEKPGDLPVEQASKYELVLNLATARLIGADLPSVLIARADEVIE